MRWFVVSFVFWDVLNWLNGNELWTSEISQLINYDPDVQRIGLFEYGGSHTYMEFTNDFLLKLNSNKTVLLNPVYKHQPINDFCLDFVIYFMNDPNLVRRFLKISYNKFNK